MPPEAVQIMDVSRHEARRGVSAADWGEEEVAEIGKTGH